MRLHIVGGFLGSGKTTAIIGAAQYLASQGLQVGVITNDQGRHLVDTTILRAQDLPVMEVTGGCFCCNFDDLNQRLSQLVEDNHPDVIFAESVGSCADVVATVIKPLLTLDVGEVKPNSFSVFADIRLLKRYLLGQEMPFSEDVNYIFGQQVEEAGILILNKSDLLPEQELEQVLELAGTAYPEKLLLVQNSLDANEIRNWVDVLQADQKLLPDRSLDLDYDRYASGEGKMAWIDRKFHLSAKLADMPKFLLNLLVDWKGLAEQHDWTRGHLKVVLSAGEAFLKISLAESGQVAEFDCQKLFNKLQEFKADSVEVLLNVLVEGNLEEIDTVFLNYRLPDDFTEEAHLDLIGQFNRQPGYPKPTHRIL